MLEGIFGNKTAEKVLLHIFHYGESHASAIANDFKMTLNPYPFRSAKNYISTPPLIASETA